MVCLFAWLSVIEHGEEERGGGGRERKGKRKREEITGGGGQRDGDRQRQRAREKALMEEISWKRRREPRRGEIAHERVRAPEWKVKNNTEEDEERQRENMRSRMHHWSCARACVRKEREQQIESDREREREREKERERVTHTHAHTHTHTHATEREWARTVVPLSLVCTSRCVSLPVCDHSQGVYFPPNRRRSIVCRVLFQQTNKQTRETERQKERERERRTHTHTHTHTHVHTRCTMISRCGFGVWWWMGCWWIDCWTLCDCYRLHSSARFSCHSVYSSARFSCETAVLILGRPPPLPAGIVLRVSPPDPRLEELEL